MDLENWMDDLVELLKKHDNNFAKKEIFEHLKKGNILNISDFEKENEKKYNSETQLSLVSYIVTSIIDYTAHSECTAILGEGFKYLRGLREELDHNKMNFFLIDNINDSLKYTLSDIEEQDKELGEEMLNSIIGNLISKNESCYYLLASIILKSTCEFPANNTAADYIGGENLLSVIINIPDDEFSNVTEQDRSIIEEMVGIHLKKKGYELDGKLKLRKVAANFFKSQLIDPEGLIFKLVKKLRNESKSLSCPYFEKGIKEALDNLEESKTLSAIVLLVIMSEYLAKSIVKEILFKDVEYTEKALEMLEKEGFVREKIYESIDLAVIRNNIVHSNVLVIGDRLLKVYIPFILQEMINLIRFRAEQISIRCKSQSEHG